MLAQVRDRWTFLLAELDKPLNAVTGELAALGLDRLLAVFDERLKIQPDATLFDIVQDRTIRVTWKQEIRAQLRQILSLIHI